MPALGHPPSTPMDTRSLYAMAIVLLLVQIPHLLHLPVWVSIAGATLVGLRIMLLHRPENHWLNRLFSPLSITLIAISSALLIRADYGYFLGRDPSVAFLFILVAAKFAEVRRARDATLLLCLAAFLLLTQYFYSQTILSAVVTLPAVIALAYALAILRDPDNPAKTKEQLFLVGKMLLHGIPLAALLFVIFPRLPGPLWSLPEDAMATTGLSDSMSPGSIGQLSQSGAVAFRVEFEGAVPAANQRYWRGPVLTEFDGRRWSQSKMTVGATLHYQGSQADIVNYTVTLQPHRQRWLFALESAVSLPRSFNAATNIADESTPPVGRLLNDGQIIAVKPVSQALRYQQRSVLNDAMHTAHYPANNTLFLPGKNPRTLALANELFDSVNSKQSYVQRVLQHFNREAYFYTLQPQLLGDAPVDEFLFDTRSGFCEHYAAAFVVLMRAAGIPARVVTGYLGGEMNGDYMIVRQSDAHAWAEAYIDGAWRRYDPTGAVAPSRVEQGLSAALSDKSSIPRMARRNPGWLRDAQLRWDAINHQWQRLVIDFDDDSQAALWERLGYAKPKLWQITLITLLIIALWGLALLGLPNFTRSTQTMDERLWKKLCRTLNANKLIRAKSESPSEYLQRAAERWPSQSIRLTLLDKHFSALRFEPLDQDTARKLRQVASQQSRALALQLMVISFVEWVTMRDRDKSAATVESQK